MVSAVAFCQINLLDGRTSRKLFTVVAPELVLEVGNTVASFVKHVLFDVVGIASGTNTSV